jgi:hypothetical protein
MRTYSTKIQNPCDGCYYETYCAGENGVGWSCAQYRAVESRVAYKLSTRYKSLDKAPDQRYYSK